MCKLQVNNLYKINGSIYRVLAIKQGGILVIDCRKRSMPHWVKSDFFIESEPATQADLGESLKGYDSLNPQQKKLVRDRYGSISMILPFVADDAERNSAIALCADKLGVSKQTIKNRLCDYLAFQDICIFLPQEKEDKPLTKDEKNFRWALNKYYYTALKLSLKETYRRLLKDKYCDEQGQLLKVVPSFRQFNYYFYKTVKQENLLITREGKGKYMRDHRAMLGNGIRDFCPTIGYGMLDSTICDIFLINDKGELLGRPIMTACVDGYSSMCLGYSLGYVGGVPSLVKLVENIITDKQEHCRKFGIEIDKEDWNCSALPHRLITDKGREYISETFSQIAELGIEIINLPPYRPELKGAVEKFFDLIQSSFKSELASKGVIFEDYQERGGTDYRKKATLTLQDFEKVVLLCIVRYNSKRIIDLPPDMVGKVAPFANALWNYKLEENKDNLIAVDLETLRLLLLPRGTGTFKRDGLIVNRLRYKNKDFKERYLTGGSCTVAYNPNDVSKVWLVEGGTFTQFDLIETYFTGKSIDEVSELLRQKKEIESEAEPTALQGSIDLTREIETITKTIMPQKVDVKNVRKRKKNV